MSRRKQRSAARSPWQERDIIEIDADNGSDRWSCRTRAAQAAWKPRAAQHQSGAIWRYGETVSSARTGAVTHPGLARQKAAE
jgi:dihydroxy-acid dehydratase